MKNYNFEAIDLVIVNFYPFQQALKNNSNIKNVIENIDIGGPTMVRAAAKNFRDVVIISDVNDYDKFIKEIVNNKGKTDLKFREQMASKAFNLTAYYDSVISNWFNDKLAIKFPIRKTFFEKE